MGHSFVAYIDESGDEGLTGAYRGQSGGRGGSSRWLTVGACVVRKGRDHELVAWRNEALKAAQKNTKTLHFSSLSHTQRLAVTKVLGGKSLRAMAVLSSKHSVRNGTFRDNYQYYWYITRYLIERISWMCNTHAIRGDGDGRVKIIFSRRGTMSYYDFQDYLKHLKKAETRINWSAIDIDGIDAQDHSKLAGLQVADVIASALACGLDVDHLGNCECRYAENLKPIIYNSNRNYFSYGVKVVPKIETIELSEDQKKFTALFA